MTMPTSQDSRDDTDPEVRPGSPVRTERLLIRPAEADDADAIWRYRSIPAVSQWLSDRPSDRQQWAERFPQRRPDLWVIESDGQLIGDLMLKVQDAWAQADVAERARGREAELGWVLDPDHAGHGYATEAVGELLRICFEDLGLHRVVAHCFAENTASWRLMERHGMRREAHSVRDSLHRDLGWLDGYSYAILADEWS